MKRTIRLCLLSSILLASLTGMASLALGQAPPVRIIFLHHSCGHNLIEEGDVRAGLAARGYEFYDHGYNGDGLRLADGSTSGTNYDVPGDNTDPDGLAEIFQQPLHDPPDNTFSHLMQYDVIAFKSCFPTSNIDSDGQLDTYKQYYLGMRERMDGYPDRLFVVVTQPPQVPGSSDAAEAQRARALAEWLASDEFLGGHPNVATFDFFGHLAGDDGFLRPEYRYDDYDGHPNARANREIGPLFVDFIDEAIRGHAGGEPRPTLEVVAETVVPSPAQGGGVMPSAGAIDDFESAADWYTGAEDGSAIEWRLDGDMAHGGSASLRVQYDIAPQEWVDFGRDLEGLEDWSAGSGLSLWVRSDTLNRMGTLMIFSGDADNPTPFEAGFGVAGDETWAPLTFEWADLTRAEWADEGGLAEIDPARITGYGFSLAAGDERVEGTLWVDDVSLITGEEPPIIAPGPADTPIVEPGEEDEPGRPSICAGATALPLGALGILVLRHHRRRGEGKDR